MKATLTLEGRGRATRSLSVDTTLAVSSRTSDTVWQNDPEGSKKCTAHLLFIISQFPAVYCEPQLFSTEKKLMNLLRLTTRSV